MIHVLLIDTWRIFAEGLRAALTGTADIAIVDIPHDVDTGVRLVSEYQPDVVVVTHELAAELFAAFVSGGSASYALPRVIVLAQAGDEAHAADLLRAGCAGWVKRDDPVGVLANAIRAVVRNETVIPAALLTRVLLEIAVAPSATSRRERLLARLTPRESEILLLMETGMGRRDIAETLHMSPHTVRTHVQRILSRLGVHSAVEAVSLVRGAGTNDPVAHANRLPRPT